MRDINIAIFASGSGSNAQNLTLYMRKNYKRHFINPTVILSNNRDAFVLERARNLGIKSEIFSAQDLEEGGEVEKILTENNIHYIILAGFLLKIPNHLINKYRGRIINIHPSLLPKYGGKGMYGTNVHRAVIKAGEKESGITIHLVDEIYDNGEHLFQAKCTVSRDESVETLAKKISELEKEHFPPVVSQYIERHTKREQR